MNPDSARPATVPSETGIETEQLPSSLKRVSYRMFRSRLACTLTSIPKRKRSILLRKLFAIAKQVIPQMEEQKTARGAAKRIRGKLPRYRKTLTATKDAIVHLDRALSYWRRRFRPGLANVHTPTWVPLIRAARNNVIDAQFEIVRAVGHQVWLMHPALRKALPKIRKVERAGNADLLTGLPEPEWNLFFPDHHYSPSHFRIRAVEYWLIASLENHLSEHIRVARRRYLIIAAVFAALGEGNWTEERIKIAIYRMRA